MDKSDAKMKNYFPFLHLKTCLGLALCVYKNACTVIPGLPILNFSGTSISHLKTTAVSLDVRMVSDSETLLWLSQSPISVIL